MPDVKKSTSVNRAKRLRKNPTQAELRLWYRLRAHRFQGLKFKRQKPVGPYVVDFVCFEYALVVEVDGGPHNEQRRDGDRIRDEWLSAQGFTVLRFWNHDVLSDTAAVLESIRLFVERKSPSPPAPLPQAGEGSVTQA
ncbi:MAG: endonuclease domain-containing protein [Nevskia sp.]|nr:endonuclease domain-containing protein [Nevskia sp.]